MFKDIIEIDFKTPISIHDANGYGNLPNGLFWKNKENEIIGIYFNKNNTNNLWNEIHTILWFYDQLDE